MREYCSCVISFSVSEFCRTNEFYKFLINLINNLKDALITQEANSRFITIKTYLKNKKYSIEINDNGGGVDESIISKIFDPYFTTKHKSQRYRMGLYVTSNNC